MDDDEIFDSLQTLEFRVLQISTDHHLLDEVLQNLYDAILIIKHQNLPEFLTDLFINLFHQSNHQTEPIRSLIMNFGYKIMVEKNLDQKIRDICMMLCLSSNDNKQIDQILSMKRLSICSQKVQCYLTIQDQILSVNMSNRILNFVGISYLKVAQHHNSCDDRGQSLLFITKAQKIFQNLYYFMIANNEQRGFKEVVINLCTSFMNLVIEKTNQGLFDVQINHLINKQSESLLINGIALLEQNQLKQHIFYEKMINILRQLKTEQREIRNTNHIKQAKQQPKNSILKQGNQQYIKEQPKNPIIKKESQKSFRIIQKNNPKSGLRELQITNTRANFSDLYVQKKKEEQDKIKMQDLQKQKEQNIYKQNLLISESKRTKNFEERYISKTKKDLEEEEKFAQSNLKKQEYEVKLIKKRKALKLLRIRSNSLQLYEKQRRERRKSLQIQTNNQQVKIDHGFLDQSQMKRNLSAIKIQICARQFIQKINDKKLQVKDYSQLFIVRRILFKLQAVFSLQKIIICMEKTQQKQNTHVSRIINLAHSLLSKIDNLIYNNLYERDRLMIGMNLIKYPKRVFYCICQVDLKNAAFIYKIYETLKNIKSMKRFSQNPPIRYGYVLTKIYFNLKSVQDLIKGSYNLQNNMLREFLGCVSRSLYQKFIIIFDRTQWKFQMKLTGDSYNRNQELDFKLPLSNPTSMGRIQIFDYQNSSLLKIFDPKKNSFNAKKSVKRFFLKWNLNLKQSRKELSGCDIKNISEDKISEPEIVIKQNDKNCISIEQHLCDEITWTCIQRVKYLIRIMIYELKESYEIGIIIIGDNDKVYEKQEQILIIKQIRIDEYENLRNFYNEYDFTFDCKKLLQQIIINLGLKQIHIVAKLPDIQYIILIQKSIKGFLARNYHKKMMRLTYSILYLKKEIVNGEIILITIHRNVVKQSKNDHLIYLFCQSTIKKEFNQNALQQKQKQQLRFKQCIEISDLLLQAIVKTNQPSRFIKILLKFQKIIIREKQLKEFDLQSNDIPKKTDDIKAVYEQNIDQINLQKFSTYPQEKSKYQFLQSKLRKLSEQRIQNIIRQKLKYSENIEINIVMRIPFSFCDFSHKLIIFQPKDQNQIIVSDSKSYFNLAYITFEINLIQFIQKYLILTAYNYLNYIYLHLFDNRNEKHVVNLQRAFMKKFFIRRYNIKLNHSDITGSLIIGMKNNAIQCLLITFKPGVQIEKHLLHQIVFDYQQIQRKKLYTYNNIRYKDFKKDIKNYLQKIQYSTEMGLYLPQSQIQYERYVQFYYYEETSHRFSGSSQTNINVSLDKKSMVITISHCQNLFPPMIHYITDKFTEFKQIRRYCDNLIENSLMLKKQESYRYIFYNMKEIQQIFKIKQIFKQLRLIKRLQIKLIKFDPFKQKYIKINCVCHLLKKKMDLFIIFYQLNDEGIFIIRDKLKIRMVDRPLRLLYKTKLDLLMFQNLDFDIESGLLRIRGKELIQETLQNFPEKILQFSEIQKQNN